MKFFSIIALAALTPLVAVAPYTSNFKFDEDLNDKALDAIELGKVQFHKQTSNDEILVFIGNTASYFYHAVKGGRDAVLLPLSGRAYSDEYSILTEEDRAAFDKFFLTPITEKALATGKKIVAIDHSQSGTTPDCFKKLLRLNCPECRLDFINLVSDAHKRGGWIKSPKTIAARSYVILPDIAIKLFNDGFVRLTPHFPHWKWHTATTTLMKDHEAQPRVAEAIKRIVEHSLTINESDVRIK